VLRKILFVIAQCGWGCAKEALAATPSQRLYRLSLNEFLRRYIMIRYDIGSALMSTIGRIVLPMVGLTIALGSSPVFAFGGCLQSSPENPSIVLGLLGAGVAAFPIVRARLKRRCRR